MKLHFRMHSDTFLKSIMPYSAQFLTSGPVLHQGGLDISLNVDGEYREFAALCNVLNCKVFILTTNRLQRDDNNDFSHLGRDTRTLQLQNTQ